MATTKIGSASRAISASDRRKASRLLAALVCCTSPLALMAQDLPTGGRVAAGNVQIGAAGSGGMTVTQTTDTAIVNWNSFDVGSGKTLRFDQPSSNSAILNRVTGDTGTDIHGRLTANGQVHIVNPNGIFIGPNGMVQAGGGFVASTLDITDEDFQNGTYRYHGDGQSNAVVNAGTIQIGRGGYAALLGGHVSNAGRVSVPMGRVGFASGERVTLDLSGDGFLQVAVPTTAESAEGQALIDNAGTVSAEGGRIEMQAATARHAVRHAINLSGVAEASSVSMQGGTIVLGGGAGGQVKVTGRVTARSTKPRQSYAVTSVVRPQARPGTGGTITVTGAEIALNGASLDASGTDGGGLIRVGGDFAGAGALPHATGTTADAGTVLRADALAQGDGGRIVLWSDVRTDAAATFSARGGIGGGDGGFIEVSSSQTLNYSGSADTRAPLGDWGMLLLDPTNITVPIGSALEASIENDLRTTNVTLDTSATPGPDVGNITINTNIDWNTGSTLTLDADNNIVLNGAINGPNGGLFLSAQNTITTGPNGRINVADFLLYDGDWRQVGVLPAFSADSFGVYFGSFLRARSGNGGAAPYEIVDVYGLQGIGTSETLLSANYILGNDIDASGTANWRVFDYGGDGFQPLAYSESEFSGTFDGDLHTISGLYIDQHYSGEGDYAEDASLFGNIGSKGIVRDLFLTDVDVSGYTAGAIASYNDGLIRAVSVTGRVAGEDSDVGGLVGANYGTIQDSRADVDVTGISTFYGPVVAGGAVGYNGGTIRRTHATGDVSVSDNGYSNLTLVAGGFVGENDGSILDAYSRGDVTIDSSAADFYSSIYAGGFVGFNNESGTMSRTYATGRINEDILAGPFVVTGGYVGENYSIIGNSNFWDTTSSGRATSPNGGVGRTTAQLQNTLGFIGFAAPRGWVFTGSGAVWAPGEAGRYPTLYTTSPVIYVVPTPMSVIYGETATTVAPGTITGGPESYVFDDPADLNFANASILGNLTFGSTNVGTTSYRIGINSFGYAGSDAFAIVDVPSTATITPRALTITADDQVKTYGQGLTLGLGDVTVAQDNGTTPTGLVAGDSVTGVTVQSSGAAANANVAGSPYAIAASGATGNGLSNYNITYVAGDLTVNRAPLTISGQDQAKTEGETFVFNGTEYTVSGIVVAGDSVDSVVIGSAGAPASAAAGEYDVTVDSATGNRLENYDITYEDGTMIVAKPVVATPPVPPFNLPNPPDNVSTKIAFGPQTGGGVAGDGGSGRAAAAAETLAETRVIADGLTARAQACPSNDQDVSRYLACLSDALNDFAGELDEIAADLPPGLANVARIVQDARRGVDAARSRAEQRLAGASSDAERQAIRNDAVNEARAAVNTAATEIRKAISLVRVEDPELASVQRETIVAVAAAVDSVSIELSRAVGL